MTDPTLDTAERAISRTIAGVCVGFVAALALAGVAVFLDYITDLMV